VRSLWAYLHACSAHLLYLHATRAYLPAAAPLYHSQLRTASMPAALCLHCTYLHACCYSHHYLRRAEEEERREGGGAEEADEEKERLHIAPAGIFWDVPYVFMYAMLAHVP